MKKSKSILCIVLSLVMVFTAVPAVSAVSVWDSIWNDTEEVEKPL